MKKPKKEISPEPEPEPARKQEIIIEQILKTRKQNNIAFVSKDKKVKKQEKKGNKPRKTTSETSPGSKAETRKTQKIMIGPTVLVRIVNPIHSAPELLGEKSLEYLSFPMC